jgi:hypothetical protein
VSIWGKPCSHTNWATTSREHFGIEIATHLTVQPDRGASIDEVGDLHHLLPLALRGSLHTPGIFQIELDAPPLAVAVLKVWACAGGTAAMQPAWRRIFQIVVS